MFRTINLVRMRGVRISGDWSEWLKLLLAAALAWQAAALLWALLVPTGPLGDWRPAMPADIPASARSALFASFNPFDRQQAAAAADAASLPTDLKLFGVRDTIGSTAGGAIVGLPDGSQVSVSVGEEIMPGVTLAATGFDYADIERQGARQRLFLDADKPPEAVGAVPAAAGAIATAAASAPSAGISVAQFRNAVSFAPRLANGSVSGVTVTAGADSATFAKIGLQPGDVIVSVNGTRITSAADAAQLANAFAAGAGTALSIERAGKPVSLTVSLSGS